MRFDIHEVEPRFSKSVAAAESGDTGMICRNDRPVVARASAEPLCPYPFGAWWELLGGAASLDHVVGPTDEKTLDGMGLRCASARTRPSGRCRRRSCCRDGRTRCSDERRSAARARPASARSPRRRRAASGPRARGCSPSISTRARTRTDSEKIMGRARRFDRARRGPFGPITVTAALERALPDAQKDVLDDVPGRKLQ